MQFITLSNAFEKVGSTLPPSDWYVWSDPPTTAAEMNQAWLIDELRDKCRVARAAGILYAALMRKRDPIDLFNNALV